MMSQVLSLLHLSLANKEKGEKQARIISSYHYALVCQTQVILRK